MTERVVSSDIRNRIDLLRERVADVEHGLSDFIDRQFDFRHIRFDDVLDFALNFPDLLLARVDRLLEAALEQSLNVSDDVFLIRELIGNRSETERRLQNDY